MAAAALLVDAAGGAAGAGFAALGGIGLGDTVAGVGFAGAELTDGPAPGAERGALVSAGRGDTGAATGGAGVAAGGFGLEAA
ncbi:MAG: hypothetical protein KGI89_17190, partial [Euryarchaeota archaeon]|nr:hypothetical protein [Euryarchaeota archaeon]